MDINQLVERELLKTAMESISSARWRISLAEEEGVDGKPSDDDLTHMANCLRSAERILRDVIQGNPESYLLQLRKMTDDAAKSYANALT